MHWAPQVEILCLPLERFDFIGRVEHLNRDLAVLVERLFHIQTAAPAPHAGTHTYASERVNDAYGTEETAIVNRLYAADFERLGYDRHL